MIDNLGRALTIIAREHARQIVIDWNLTAFHAPSECYPIAYNNEALYQRRARKHAEAVARRSYRTIVREAKRRGGVELHEHNRHWVRLVQRHLPY